MQIGWTTIVGIRKVSNSIVLTLDEYNAMLERSRFLDCILSTDFVDSPVFQVALNKYKTLDVPEGKEHVLNFK